MIPASVITIIEHRDGADVSHDFVMDGLTDPIAYTEYSPDAESAQHKLRALAMALLRHFKDDVPFLEFAAAELHSPISDFPAPIPVASGAVLKAPLQGGVPPGGESVGGGESP